MAWDVCVCVCALARGSLSGTDWRSFTWPTPLLPEAPSGSSCHCQACCCLIKWHPKEKQASNCSPNGDTTLPIHLGLQTKQICRVQTRRNPLITKSYFEFFSHCTRLWCCKTAEGSSEARLLLICEPQSALLMLSCSSAALLHFVRGDGRSSRLFVWDRLGPFINNLNLFSGRARHVFNADGVCVNKSGRNYSLLIRFTFCVTPSAPTVSRTRDKRTKQETTAQHHRIETFKGRTLPPEVSKEEEGPEECNGLPLLWIKVKVITMLKVLRNEWELFWHFVKHQGRN